MKIFLRCPTGGAAPHVSCFSNATLPGPVALPLYQACFDSFPATSSVRSLWLGSCHPEDVIPLYSSVIGPVYSSVTSLICVRTQLEHDQVESLLSIESCSQLKVLVLYVKFGLTPDLPNCSLRYVRGSSKFVSAMTRTHINRRFVLRRPFSLVAVESSSSNAIITDIVP